MIWCVIGLLYLSGDPISVRVCDYRTLGNCIEAKRAIYRSAFAHPRSGALLICREYQPET